MPPRERPQLPRIGYRVREVMEITGLGRSTIYDRIQAGDLDVRYVGRIPLIMPESLAALPQRRARSPKGAAPAR